jgi:hypothetical protein
MLIVLSLYVPSQDPGRNLPLQTQRVRIPVPSFPARPGDRGAATSGIDDQAEMRGLQFGCSASQSAQLGGYGFRRELTMKIGMLAALAGLAVSIAVRLAGWLPFPVACIAQMDRWALPPERCA